MIYSARVQEALAAGFSIDEIKAEAHREYTEGLSAGFSSDEGKEYLRSEYGLVIGPQPDDAEASRDFAALMFQDLSDATSQPQTKANATNATPAKEASGAAESLFAGYQTSLTGLMVRGENPNVVLGPDADIFDKTAAAFGQIMGDLPGLVIGGTIGAAAGLPAGPGAVVASGATAMGVTEGIRAFLIDSYTNGTATTPEEVFNRTIKTLLATGQGAVIGGVTGGAGFGARGITAEMGMKGVKAAGAHMAADLTALTTATSAMHGQLPTASDIAVNAITLGGLKGAHFYSSRLSDVFVRTGKTPGAVNRDSVISPMIREDLAAINLDTPRAYRAEFKRVFGTGEGAVFTSKASAMRAAAESGVPVQEFQIHRNAPVIQAREAVMAKTFKKFMDTDNGRAALEKMDPTFFREYPDFFEKYKSVNQERLVPTARKMFNEPTPEFVDFLRNDLDPGTIRALAGPGFNVGKNVLSVDWSAIKVGDKIIPLNDTVVMNARHKPTGNMEIDAAMQKIDSVLSIGETTGELTFRQRASQTYQATVDKFNPLQVAKKGLSEPYFEARMSAGAPGIAMHWMDYGTTKFGTQEIAGKSLGGILKGVKDTSEFSRYLVAKAAKSASERGVETDIDVNAAYTIVNNKDMIAKYEGPAKEVLKYKDDLLQYSYDAGLMTERQLKAMRSKNAEEVPLSKILEAFEPELRELVPTEAAKTIIDPMESIIRSTFVVARMADQNAAKMSIAKSFGTPIANKSGMLDAFGERRSSYATQVRYFENGKAKIAAVPKEIADTARLLDAETAQIYSFAYRAAAGGASVLRAGAVLSPEFMSRNIIRDQWNAAINSNSGYIFGIDAMRGIGALVNAKTNGKVFKQFDGVYQDWLRNGGANASLVSLDRTYTQDVIRQLSKQPVRNLISDPVKHHKDILMMINPLNAPKGALRGLQTLSEYSEMGTRLGEFMRAKERGLPSREAAYESREITIDFMRIGAQTKAINALSAFFNAKIQGWDRLRRSVGGNPAEVLSKAVAGIAVPTALLSIVNNDIMHNSPDSEMAQALREAQNWQKTAFWLIPAGDTLLRIPKPPDWAIAMCAPIDLFFDYAFNKGERTFLQQMSENGFLGSIAESVIPNPFPTVLAPPTEAITNYSFFTGNNVVPTFMERMLPETQYRPGTTETAKVLASLMARLDPAIGAPVMSRVGSPLHIDNLVRGWTGTLGTYALELTDWTMAMTGITNPISKPTKQLAEYPLIKAFTVKYPTAGSSSIDKFNKEAAVVEKKLNSIKALLKEGNASATDRAELMIMEGGFGSLQGIRQAMGNMSQFIRQTHFSDQIDPDTKRQLIEDTYIEMIQLAREGRKIVKEIRDADNE